MNNENEINPKLSRYVIFDMLYTDLAKASMSQDIEAFKGILTSIKSPLVQQEEIDKAVFFSTYQLADKEHSKPVEELLKYLIFDYKINENSYFGIIKNANNPSLNMRVENMFTLRKLNENLNQDLNTNSENIKRLKV
jgi:hypothetical protein